MNEIKGRLNRIEQDTKIMLPCFISLFVALTIVLLAITSFCYVSITRQTNANMQTIHTEVKGINQNIK